MKGLEKIYWKSHPSWLGSIDCVRFNTLPHWKKMAICQSPSDYQILDNLYTILEQKKRLYTSFEKKRGCVQFLASSGLGSLNKLLTQPSAWQG